MWSVEETAKERLWIPAYAGMTTYRGQDALGTAAKMAALHPPDRPSLNNRWIATLRLKRLNASLRWRRND